MCGKVFFLECFFCVSGEIPPNVSLMTVWEKALADTVLRMTGAALLVHFPCVVGAEGNRNGKQKNGKEQENEKTKKKVA